MSSAQVTVQIPTADVTTAGSASIVVNMPGSTASNALQFNIAPFSQTACLLFGTYAFLFTGFDATGPVSIAGNLGVDAGGNVSGEQDFKDGATTRAAEAITAGSCMNGATSNTGTLTVTTATGTSTYRFVTEGTHAGGIGRFAESGDVNGVSGSGRLVFAPPSGYFCGAYAFGLTGGDGKGGRMSVVGRFSDKENNACTFNATGTLSGGDADISDAGVASNVVVSGSVAVPDGYGRALATISLGAQALQIAFYVIDSSSGFAVEVDGAASTPILGGLISAQANAGLYANGNLNAPLIFSTWGAAPGATGSSATSVGLASGFNSGAGTFSLLLDQMAGGTPNLNQSLSGTYSVASDGRATLSYTAGATAYSWVLYLDGDNDGYIVQTSANTADFGFFEPQKATTLSNGTFAAGTWFSSVPASPSTAAQIALNNGTITGTSPAGALSGSYNLSPSGRGTATLNLAVFGSTDVVFYVIASESIEMMGSDSGTTGDAIGFLHL